MLLARLTHGLIAAGACALLAPWRADAAPAGEAVFLAHCAVCHGAQAAGIPGSFPALHEQIAAFAQNSPGRDYLVMVVTTGLTGALRVEGVDYRGVMPAQSTLSEADVAAALNYIASGLGKRKSAARAFTAQEVISVRARRDQSLS